jgi:lipoyl(octanoyl) transferase
MPTSITSHPSHPTYHWLGRVPYADALEIQETTVRARIANACSDQVFLLEHDPVYTIGRTRDTSSLRNAAALPHPVIEIGRGGQATYHGPGQLIGYPIIDLKNYVMDLHRYLRALEEAIITYAKHLNIPAQRRDGLTGVWVEERKLASIGVGVRHWVTMHGFALNVCGPLTGYESITPCGIAGVTMTTLEMEGASGLTVIQAAQDMQPHLQVALDGLE